MSNISNNAPMAPANELRLRDYNYIKTHIGPAAGANVNTAALDLVQPQFQTGQSPGAPNTAFAGSTGPFSVTTRFWVNVTVGAGASTANNKNLNISLEHTGALANGAVDTSNYVSIPELANPLIRCVDANGAGFAAAAANVMLPPGVKRFVRAKAALEGDGGTTAGETVTLQLLF